MQCRACLKTDFKSSTKLDGYNVFCYNVITNLNVRSGDDMPQQLCMKCTKDLQFCIAFRERCISSNSVLSQQSLNKSLDIKEIKVEVSESKCDTQFVLPKTEIINPKKEEPSDEEFFEEPLSMQDERQETGDSFQSDDDSKVVERKIYTKSDLKKKKILKKKNVKLPKDKIIRTKTKLSNEDIKKFECGLCLESFNKDKLFEHVDSHKQSNYCGICSKYFESWPTLLLHRVEHLTRRSCHICLKHFRLNITLQNHYNDKHFNNTINNLLKCSKCNKIFKNVFRLRKHMSSMHSDKSYKCDKCSLVFSQRTQFIYHKKTRHVEKTLLDCDQCDYKTSFPTNLRQHKIRLHNADRVLCNECGAALASAAALERHRCSGRHVVCPVCGKLLGKSDRLTTHMRTHTGERKYKCDRCPAAYVNSCGLRDHMDRHDGVRRHTCEYCPMDFSQRGALIRHRRLHTGERPHVCQVCSKGFTNKYNLQVHMKVHGEYLTRKKTETEAPDAIQNKA